MNRLRFRYSAVVLFAASLVGSLLMGSCAGRPTRSAVAPPQGNAGQNLDVHVSNVGSGGGAPSGGLRVDLHVFAKDAQNPVNLEYSVTNIMSQPILSPVFVTITLPTTNSAELIDVENDMTVTVPISPYVSLLSGNLTSIIAPSLKPGETTPTVTIQLQINRTRWDPVTSLVELLVVSYPDAAAIAKGSAEIGIGRAGTLFRLRNDTVESSNVGWPEDTNSVAKFGLIHGTVIANSTVIPATMVLRNSRATPIPTVSK